MREYLVSIIIPIYNAESYINKCIESVMNQSYTKIEILLIDDGSTDESPKLCDHFSCIDDRIQVVHTRNSGAGAARNVGLNIANGEYICFVDADDQVNERYIEYLVYAITGNELGICGFTTAIDGKYSQTLVPDIEKMTKNETIKCMLNPNEAIVNCYGYLWNKIFKKRIIEENHLSFDHKYFMWEDMCFCCKYVLCIENVGYVNADLYYYNDKNKNSISHNLTTETMELWNEASIEIEQMLIDKGLYDEVGYKSIIADLYMKTLIVNTHYNIQTRGEIITFLDNNRALLRKKYKIYYKICRTCPIIWRVFGRCVSV